MTDILLTGIIVLLVGAAAAYILKAKRSGAKCIGCPASGMCPGKAAEHAACRCGCCSMEK